MACSHDHSEERKLMDMPLEEKVRLCHMYRRKGNLYHQEGQYRRAALQYRQALIRYDFCFPEEPSMQQELDSLRQTCLLNSAACFLRCRELDEVADCCYQVLQSDPDNVKALFRRAQVHRMRDNFQEAKEDIIRALQTKPDDYQLRKESAILKSKMASYKTQSKIMGENIFGGVERRGGWNEDWENVAGAGHTPAGRGGRPGYNLVRHSHPEECRGRHNLYEAVVIDLDD
ncbi:unnamed protein product [Discosporangium mesarthrocarpum]